MAGRSRRPTRPTEFLILDGPDGPHGDLWARTMSLMRMEGHDDDYTTENPWSWGLFGIAHWICPESQERSDALLERPTLPKYEGYWEFMAVFIEDAWRKMDLDVFESMSGLSGLPMTVFVEKDWRFYWRMTPEEVENLFLAASIMES